MSRILRSLVLALFLLLLSPLPFHADQWQTVVTEPEETIHSVNFGEKNERRQESNVIFDNSEDSASDRELALENRSAENVHLFIEGDTFGPHNRVLPGRSRMVTGEGKIIAGRGGQILSTLLPGPDTKRVTYQDGDGLKAEDAPGRNQTDLILWGKQTRGVSGRNGTLDGNVLRLPFSGVIVDVSGFYGQCGIRSGDRSTLLKMNPRKGDIFPAGDYTVLPELKHSQMSANVTIRFERYRKKPSGDLTIDPEKIKAVRLKPVLLRAEAEKPRDLPEIYGVRSETDEEVLLKDPDVIWITGSKASTAGNRLTVRKGVKVGTTFKLQASVKLGFRTKSAAAEVKVVEKLKTGYVHGTVRYVYDKAQVPYPAAWPRRPQSAVVTLSGLDGDRQQDIGPSGEFRFDALREGSYRIGLRDVNIANLPTGWQSGPDQRDAARRFYIPDFTANLPEVWVICRHLNWRVALPLSNEGCVYGRVTCNGEPVKDATVTLVGHMGRQMKTAETNNQGEYRIKTDKLDGGEYTVSALKMAGKPKIEGKPITWATSKDIIGPVEAGREVPKYVGLPLNDPRGVRVDIPCLTRGDLYGDAPPVSPGSLWDSY